MDGTNSNSGTSVIIQGRCGSFDCASPPWEAIIPQEPELELRLVNLPGYSPDFNADEAIWGWAREEATGNLCLGSRAAVRERVGKFLAGLSSRKDEVRRRCRTVLQSRAETLPRDSRPDSQHPANARSHLGGLEGASRRVNRSRMAAERNGRFRAPKSLFRWLDNPARRRGHAYLSPVL